MSTTLLPAPRRKMLPTLEEWMAQEGSEKGKEGAIKKKLPNIPELISRTGKLLLTPGPGMSQNPPPLPPTEEPRDEDPIPTDTSACLKEAAVAISEFRLRRARTLLEATRNYPSGDREMWLAWTNLGYAYYRLGKFPEAEEAFCEALAFGPDDMASHFNVALGQHLNQKYDLAFASYLAANRIEPNHPKVWCNLGALYFQKDLLGRAEEALRHTIRTDESYARAWDNLGAILGAQGKFEEAQAACQRALDLRENYPEADFKMALIYFHRGELTQAGQCFRRASTLPLLAPFCEVFLTAIQDRPDSASAE